MKILLTGASGTLGSAVLPRLAEDGHDVRPMSRRPRPGWVVADLAAGSGLTEAVRDVDAVVHLASSPIRTRKTDVEGTRRLVAAAKAAGVRHVVYISIIGIDRVPLPYYRIKLAAEAVIRASGVPFTVVRAAQFPSLIDLLLRGSSKVGPVLIDKNLRFQPVAVEDVADVIASVLAAGPDNGIVEIAGPHVAALGDLARDWQRARGSRGPVWPIRWPGRIARAVRTGALTTETRPTGTRTWLDYLAEKY
ncbi:MAG TPA: NAD(P)H-binding protein [Actinoplanes sp.]|nr:NAD(P)H-binding protein [Actinoplanes sp.]